VRVRERLEVRGELLRLRGQRALGLLLRGLDLLALLRALRLHGLQLGRRDRLALHDLVLEPRELRVELLRRARARGALLRELLPQQRDLALGLVDAAHLVAHLDLRVQQLLARAAEPLGRDALERAERRGERR